MKKDTVQFIGILLGFVLICVMVLEFNNIVEFLNSVISNALASQVDPAVEQLFR